MLAELQKSQGTTVSSPSAGWEYIIHLIFKDECGGHDVKQWKNSIPHHSSDSSKKTFLLVPRHPHGRNRHTDCSLLSSQLQSPQHKGEAATRLRQSAGRTPGITNISKRDSSHPRKETRPLKLLWGNVRAGRPF